MAEAGPNLPGEAQFEEFEEEEVGAGAEQAEEGMCASCVGGACVYSVLLLV